MKLDTAVAVVEADADASVPAAVDRAVVDAVAVRSGALIASIITDCPLGSIISMVNTNQVSIEPKHAPKDLAAKEAEIRDQAQVDFDRKVLAIHKDTEVKLAEMQAKADAELAEAGAPADDKPPASGGNRKGKGQ